MHSNIQVMQLLEIVTERYTCVYQNCELIQKWRRYPNKDIKVRENEKNQQKEALGTLDKKQTKSIKTGPEKVRGRNSGQ